jgi:hypothetical protein
VEGKRRERRKEIGGKGRGREGGQRRGKGGEGREGRGGKGRRGGRWREKSTPPHQQILDPPLIKWNTKNLRISFLSSMVDNISCSIWFLF